MALAIWPRFRHSSIGTELEIDIRLIFEVHQVGDWRRLETRHVMLWRLVLSIAKPRGSQALV